MDKLKIVVIGNCQARPLSHCISQLNKNLTILDPLIVHLLQPDDMETIWQRLLDADVIISQQLNDSYPIECLRTENLRKQYSEKVVTIPNIFLTKYCPDLVYISSPEFGRVSSLMDIYHSKTIFEAWVAKEKEDSLLQKLNDEYFWRDRYQDNVSKSISELKKRESDSDISVLELIEEVSEKERPFFTFNHPSSNVLATFSRKLLAHINEPITDQIIVKKEPLASVIAPIFEGAKKAFNYKFESPSYCVGFQPIVKNGKVASKGIRKILSNRDFVKHSYDLYDRTLTNKNLSNIRYTPNY